MRERFPQAYLLQFGVRSRSDGGKKQNKRNEADVGATRIPRYRVAGKEGMAQERPLPRPPWTGRVDGMIAYDDVRTLTADRIAADCGRLPSVIVGSPPCQDASTANQRGRGVDGERTGLFFDAIRIVGECRPVWCVFENVPGIRTRGADRVLGALEALGYTCWPLVVGAWHAGAPHRRNRVWIVAANTDSHGQHGEPGYAEVGRMVGASAADANSNSIREQPGRRRGTFGEGAAVSGYDAARNPDRARLALGEGIGSDALAELPPAIRAIAEGSEWNGGAVGLAHGLRVADGLSSRLARACISAYGDAVLPQITEAIGRVMMRLCPTDGTVLDLFSGAAGGWSLGMHRAGYKTLAFCEIDPWRRAAFAKVMR